jgi:hypothetical protein
MSLPDCFCWTRFGTEAGQSADQILARKEQERVANRGLFFWGIGNAIGPSMVRLLQRSESPEVVFSPILSQPRREDRMPVSVAVWTEAQTLSNEDYRLPSQSLITSRFDPLKPRARHYALVCYSETPIRVEFRPEQIQFANLRNLLTSRPVGASQVTAVVQLSTNVIRGKSISYDIAFRARLTPPYFVLLRAPIPLADCGDGSNWAETIRQSWDSRQPRLA